MLRWLTAGESHGPSLVAILEGLPAHVRVTTDDIADALARRRLGYGRGARMKFEQDEVDDRRRRPARRDPGRPGRDPDRQHRVAQVGEGDVGRPGRPGRARGAGPQRRADPAPARATPTWSACRSTASTRPGRSSSAPRPARPRPGSRSAGSPPTSSSRRSAPGSSPTWSSSAASARPHGVGARARTTSPASTTTRCAASTPTPSKQMVAAIDQAHKDGDTLGGVVEVVVHGLPPGPRLARALGPPARRPARRRADGHPGDQGRRGRRRLRRSPPTPGSLAHDEIVPTDDGHPPYVAAAPAAPRAA